jgi:hypothetical protein
MDNPEHSHNIVKKCQFCGKENCQRYLKESKQILPNFNEMYFCLIDTKSLVDSGEYPKDHFKEAYDYISKNIGITNCGVDGGFSCTGCIRDRINKLLSDEKELIEIKEEIKKLREDALKTLEENEKNRKNYIDPDSIGEDIGATGFGLDKDQQKEMRNLWEWQEQSLKSKIILGGPIKESKISNCKEKTDEEN